MTERSKIVSKSVLMLQAEWQADKGNAVIRDEYIRALRIYNNKGLLKPDLYIILMTEVLKFVPAIDTLQEH